MRNKEGLVDDLITSIPGEWKFDEQVSQHFDTHVRKSVPLYEEVQKAVIEISEWFIRDNSVVYDLGSSTGVYTIEYIFVYSLTVFILVSRIMSTISYNN